MKSAAVPARSTDSAIVLFTVTSIAFRRIPVWVARGGWGVGRVGSGDGAGYKSILLVLIIVRQGPSVLAVDVSRDCFDIFSLSPIVFSSPEP